MKYNKILTALLSLLILGATSCSDDWNDHYASSQLGEGTLWGAISGDPNLSNFADVLKATGYDKALSSSQVYTVFAPTNDKFTESDRDAVIAEYNQQLSEGYKESKNTAVKEFVQNHIALYNYSVAPETPDTTIRVMNGKYLSFTNSSFSGKQFLSSNVLTGNGILYTIGEKADYVPNIFEYIKKDADLDSVKNFVYMSHPWQLHTEVFNSAASVPGEIVDGKQQYLDSVTVTRNKVLLYLGALLNSEDSSYYALMPSNKVWKEQLETNQKYFQYDAKVTSRDSLEYTYPRIFILAGAQFSKTLNPLLGETEAIDSIVSPYAVSYSMRKNSWGSYDEKRFQYDNPYSSNGIFANTVNTQCSNGVVLKTDTWNIDRIKSTFILSHVVEGEDFQYVDSLSGETRSSKPSYYRTYVGSDSKYYNQVSEHGFATLSPSTAAMPGVLFDIYGLLSNVKYDVYVQTCPARAYDSLSVDTLPTRFIAKLYCTNKNGVMKNYHMMDTDDATPVEDPSVKNSSSIINEEDGGDITTYNPRGIRYKSSFYVDPSKVDKIKLGTFTFPTCSYGLSDAHVKLYLEVNVLSADVNNKKFTNSLRIDKIIFQPHED